MCVHDAAQQQPCTNASKDDNHQTSSECPSNKHFSLDLSHFSKWHQKNSSFVNFVLPIFAFRQTSYQITSGSAPSCSEERTGFSKRSYLQLQLRNSLFLTLDVPKRRYFQIPLRNLPASLSNTHVRRRAEFCGHRLSREGVYGETAKQDDSEKLRPPFNFVCRVSSLCPVRNLRLFA